MFWLQVDLKVASQASHSCAKSVMFIVHVMWQHRRLAATNLSSLEDEQLGRLPCCIPDRNCIIDLMIILE